MGTRSKKPGSETVYHKPLTEEDKSDLLNKMLFARSRKARRAAKSEIKRKAPEILQRGQ